MPSSRTITPSAIVKEAPQPEEANTPYDWATQSRKERLKPNLPVKQTHPEARVEPRRSTRRKRTSTRRKRARTA
jgi:hypothetical protein